MLALVQPCHDPLPDVLPTLRIAAAEKDRQRYQVDVVVAGSTLLQSGLSFERVERAEVVARRDPQRAGEVERVRLSTEVLQERGLAVALASRPSSLALPRQRLVLSGAGRGLEPELRRPT